MHITLPAAKLARAPAGGAAPAPTEAGGRTWHFLARALDRLGLANTGPGRRAKPLRYVSIHFPKSAGTSLRVQLSERFGRRTLLDYAHDPLATGSAARAADLPRGVRCVHGHFSAWRYDAVPDAFRMTFLREPVDNLIATYLFWRNYPEHGNPVHTRFLRERPSVDDFARYEPIRYLMSETYFGGYDMRRLDFVGFHETRAADLARLRGLSGLSVDPEVHVNRTQCEPEDRLALAHDRALHARLAAILAADIRFYERQRDRHG